MDADDTRELIADTARSLGATLVGMCPTDRWDEVPIQDPEFRPKAIWPWARTAVVMGIPLFAPMVATTPSMVYQELYNTSNRILDDIGYRMSAALTSSGFRAMYFPRDCYFSVEALLERPVAAFSHVVAAYYAGLGTIGDSHNLLTREYGPRVRMVTVLTDAEPTCDDILDGDLCIHCGRCLRECPSHAFTDTGGDVYDMDKLACTEYHLQLKRQRHWPCGRCIAVCPVGNDLRRYRGERMVTDSGIEHCRTYGS